MPYRCKTGSLASILALLILLLGLGGCNSYLARRVVTAPNLKDPIRGTDAPQETLDRLYVGRQLRISVGPPSASLSVWICEPYTGAEDFSLHGQGRHINAEIKRTPSTVPSEDYPEPKGTVFLLHGIEDNKELGPYVMYREMLVHAGYRCIQIDLRGHGRSTGDWLTYGVVESRDLTQVLDALDQQNLIAGEVGVMGISYGASVGIQWAAKDSRIMAVVALEPFDSLEHAAIDAAPLVLGRMRWLYSDKDLHNALKQAGKLANFDTAQASPLALMPDLRAHTLLIHSRADELVPVAHSQRLHDTNPAYTGLILVEKQSHFWMWWQSRSLIDAASKAWLDRYVAPQPVSPTTVVAQ